MSLGPLYVLSAEVSVEDLCPFLNWVVCLPAVESGEFFIYFGDQTLVRGIIGKYIFADCWFPFHCIAVFFSHAEAFYFDEVIFVYSSLYVPCSGNISVKILLCGIYDIFLYVFCSRTFMVLRLTFKSFIHLELIFVYGVHWWSSFIFLQVAIQIS